jgi:hypothetical protein
MACIGSILLIIVAEHWSFTRFHLFNVEELRKGMSFPGSTLLIASLVEQNLFDLIVSRVETLMK